MVKLLKTPAPGNWEWSDGKNPMENQEKSLKTLGDKVIKFPMADSYAFYYVKTLKPLVLQHIPYCDGWHAPTPLIRGLRTKDVEEMLEREKRMREIFNRQE